MKTAIWWITAGVLAMIPLTGCAQGDRAKSAAPTLAELPTFETLEPMLPINVGVEGAGESRGYRIVPHYGKIEPTPEERKILGIIEPTEVDALVLYRPPPDPAQGVSRESTERYWINEAGGMSVGICLAESSYSNYGYAGRHFGVDQQARSRASVNGDRERVGWVGIPWTMQVGENLPRSKAARERRYFR